MKQILTLALFSFITLSSFSQWSNNGKSRNDPYNKDQTEKERDTRYSNYNNSYRTEAELLQAMNLNRNQERRIQRINERYWQQVQQMNSRRYRSAEAKRWALEKMEQERKSDITDVLDRRDAERYEAWYARNKNTSWNDYSKNERDRNTGRW